MGTNCQLLGLPNTDPSSGQCSMLLLLLFSLSFGKPYSPEDSHVDLYIPADEQGEANFTGCETVCPSQGKPVCGSDKQTHINECHLEKEACQSGQHIDIV